MSAPFTVRANRSKNFITANFRYFWNKYTVQTWVYSTYGVLGTLAMFYHMSRYGVFGQHYRSHYRTTYTVVRPDDPRALKKRPPEEYPPPWMNKSQYYASFPKNKKEKE